MGVARRHERGPTRGVGQGRVADPGGVGGHRSHKFTQAFATRLRWRLCGRALPSPTSGGLIRDVGLAGRPLDGPPRRTLRSYPASASARTSSSGSGERDVDRLAARGMREGQPRRVQELAAQPVEAGRAVVGVAADRVADRLQVDADLVRAAGLQAHAQQRRAARSAALDLEVRDRRRAARRCRSTCACARAGRGRSAPRSCPSAPAGGPRRARGTRGSIARAGSEAFSARCTSSLLATTSSPEVSRSRRCTIPARQSSSPPAMRPASACASVPLAVAARGVHDDARRLVDDDQVLVLVGDRERARRRRPDPARPPVAARRAPRRARPRARAGACARPRRRRARAPPRSAAPPASASPSGPARNASRRSPARLRRDVELHRSAPLAYDDQQRQHADRDRRVGDVERRPVRQLDEVDDRALAQAVDDVAQRAAEQQPGRAARSTAAWRSARSTRPARRRRSRSRLRRSRRRSAAGRTRRRCCAR